MTSMATVPQFHLHARLGPQITFHSDTAAVAHVFVPEHDLVRVMVLPHGQLDHPRTWAIAPGADDIPSTGRDRFDLQGFSLPLYDLVQAGQIITITTAQLRLSIDLCGFKCVWQSWINNAWQAAAADRSTQSYNFGWWDHKVYHYLQRTPDEMYFGLGERAGETDRHGNRYSMINVDAMGYNARTTDPLYKHIPFYLTWKTQTSVPFGLFYDTLADCHFDMGRELDNYHGHYRYFCAEHGDLDYWFIGGATLADVVKRYTWLTGRPALMPKWGSGYSGSTMTYTDAPDAQNRMQEFLQRCEQHDILCDSFHLSSGYTSIASKRYVFNWDTSKFPDPKAFVDSYLQRGVKLVPNIKPCLLRDHPLFAEAAAAGLFIQAADGQPELVQFWDETGAYLDFTNPATLSWWRDQVSRSLLNLGMAATWNDNNEFEIWNPNATCHNFGQRRSAAQSKPLQTLLMLQASRTAQLAHAPNSRPFLVSRSGGAGMQRYVQTWSGDNLTAWETLRYNIKMGIGLALSGVSNSGHDIGGFAGPAPEPELFLRWVQAGVLLPRFSIHSWNSDCTVNEPWMYPAITPAVRALIHFRYRMLPQLYHLLWRSHAYYEPVIPPTFLAFPADPQCLQANDDMLIGTDLLFAPVVSAGQAQREVYLPEGTGWYDFRDGQYFAGGQRVQLPAALDTLPPLLAREGAMIALNVAQQHFGQPLDERGFAIFPALHEATFSTDCFDDDGISPLADPAAPQHLWRLVLSCYPQKLCLQLTAPVAKPATYITLLLPAGETRPLFVEGWIAESEQHSEGLRRLKLKCATAP